MPEKKGKQAIADALRRKPSGDRVRDIHQALT